MSRVPDGDVELLRYLSGLGLLPGETVEVVRVEPFDGPLTVLAGGVEHPISHEIAAQSSISESRESRRR